MLKVSITTNNVQVKKGVSNKTGKPYEIREQPAWVWLIDEQGKQQPHPVTFMLLLDRDQAAYALGDYILLPSSIESGRFGSLHIKPQLRKVEAAVRQAA